MELDIKPKLDNIKQVHHVSATNINLYNKVPFGQLTLEECEDLFRQRIEALSVLERTNDSDDKVQIISNSLKEIKSHIYKSNCLTIRAHDANQQRLDQFSHMLARLYCIYNPNLWDWFKNCEKRFLRYRLRHDYNPTSDQLETILTSFQFDFKRVRSEELSELKKKNIIGWNWKERNHEEVFKVSFTKALRFIARRAVALQDGYAFLTRNEIISIVCDVFDEHLDNELKFARQHLNFNNVQVQYLIEALDIVYYDYKDKIDEDKRRNRTNKDVENQNPYRIDVNDIEHAVKNHFPPCIRYLHESLVQDHHLRHNGRLIYGTFLRSGGVDMDQAIEFWRREFTKKIPNDKFERDYKYNIRHLYGREGHKKALSCFSCDKIINDNPPGPSDKHGCPFKHFDETNVKGMLSKHGLKEVDIESIMTHVTSKDPKLACCNYFKFSKGEYPTEPIKNPIHFYYESKRLENRPKEEPAVEMSTEGEQPIVDTNYADEEMTDDL